MAKENLECWICHYIIASPYETSPALKRPTSCPEEIYPQSDLETS